MDRWQFKGLFDRVSEMLKDLGGGGKDIIREFNILKERKVTLQYYLEDLEKTREKGEISDETYNELKNEYITELKSVEKKLSEISLKINKLKMDAKKEIEKLNFEKRTTLKLLDNLHNLYTEGKISEREYEKKKNELSKKLNLIEKQIKNKESLIERLNI